MKKILFFAAALAALLTSCNKEQATQDFEEVSTVYATFAQDNSTKVVMGKSDGTNTPLNWNQGDEIVVVNINGSSENLTYGMYQTVSSVQDGDSRAEFVYVEGTQIDPSVPHFAVYPYERIVPDNYKFEYESEQAYVENSFDPAQMPLAAKNASGNSFTFTAQAAVVRLKVSTTTSDVKVTSIELSSATKALTGFAVANLETATYGVPESSTGKTTTLVCPDGGVAINGTAKEFNIIVPGQTYPSGDLTITVKTNKGDIVKTSKAAATFAAGKVYNIGISGEPIITTGTAKRTGNIDVKWVQLWEDGPKFAEYNIGAPNNRAQDYGSYFTWGGEYENGESIEWIDDHNTGNENLTGNNDTATKLWGSNWRMPTLEELKQLANHEYCQGQWTNDYEGTGVKGVIFTGIGVYASNSVFLPAAGECHSDGVKYRGSSSYYWSSTKATPRADATLLAYSLGLNSAQWNTGDDARFDGFQVRAVLKE